MNETISKIINHPVRNHVLVGAASFIGGGVAGYFLARRRLLITWSYQREVYDDMTDGVKANLDLSKIEFKEIALDPRLNGDIRVVEPEPVIIDEDVYVSRGADFVADHLTDRIEQDLDMDEEPSEPLVVTHNVFAQTDDDWNYEEELAKRDSSQPYILHKDEFYTEEDDLNQVTLTYYAGDDILVDEEDKPIYNYSTVIGPLRFGHGSGDPRVFYVRNEQLGCEYEIIRDEGLYSVEVLGLEIEVNARSRDLKHSAVPKFRATD